jgi:hypothetical protein
MTFAQAVESYPRLQPHYHTGLGALGGNRTRVRMRDARRIIGSLDIEAAQHEVSAGSPAWDYGIGVRSNRSDVVIWLEVHPADSSHVEKMIEKFQSLAAFLKEYTPDFLRLSRRYVWLATRRVGIAPASRERRRLNALGIQLRSKRLDLDSVV